MASEEFFCINSPRIVHEIIEGEAVIINMELGHYYSTDQAGAVIWERISRTACARDLVEAVARRYSGSPEQIEAAVRQFLSELQQENLVIPVPVPEKAEVARENEAGNQMAEDRPPFVPPSLTKYTDMEDLLLLDPIHEVDESGWPHALSDETQA